MSFIGEIADFVVSIAESIGEFLWDVRALFVLWFLYMMFCCAFFPERPCPGCGEKKSEKFKCRVWPSHHVRRDDNHLN
jgi:hypothetical protein